MKIFKTPQEMQAWSLAVRDNGFKIAFVPTMGFLHEGHLSLLRAGKKQGDKLVLSLFVNPTQFSPHEDLKCYPRDTKGDLDKAESCGVDAAFLPTVDAMYPNGFETTVTLEKLPNPLCGQSRPTHFRGVATVVLKLLNIVQPHLALFGEKDYQQLKIIQKMAQDLNVPVDIIGMPIVREMDGLAMSSRNQYLTPKERKAALRIHAGLKQAQLLVDQGKTDMQNLLETVHATLLESRLIEIDYVSFCHPETLEELKSLQLPTLLAIACFIGKTRFIDNCLLK